MSIAAYHWGQACRDGSYQGEPTAALRLLPFDHSPAAEPSPAIVAA